MREKIKEAMAGKMGGEMAGGGGMKQAMAARMKKYYKALVSQRC